MLGYKPDSILGTKFLSTHEDTVYCTSYYYYSMTRNTTPIVKKGNNDTNQDELYNTSRQNIQLEDIIQAGIR